MKRMIVIVIVIATIILIVGFVSYKYLLYRHDYEKYRTMPVFLFETVFGKVQSTATLPRYDGYVVQFFSPECEVCQMEARDYFKFNDSLQNICFLMLSTESSLKIKEFAIKHQLYNSDNFVFGRIETVTIEDFFGTVPIPSLFIYDSEKKMVNKMRVAKSTSILKQLKMSN